MFILFGAGGHGKVVAEILLKCSISEFVFYDEFSNLDYIHSIKIINNIQINDGDSMIICIGNNQIRKKISLQYNCNFKTAIHPFTSIANDSYLGEGSVIMAGSIINSFVTIGKHCIINSGSIVEHDCIIENFVHLSPNCTLCGNVKIGEGSHIGAGAVIIPNVKIGKWTTIGAGAVVIKDVPDYVTVVGNPAKIINDNNTK